MAKNKTCFVIGPIGKPESEIRKWADKVFEHIIKPAVEACGYDTPVRADHIPRPGSITTEVLQHLLNDDLVIADLTGPNANAFYELAVRHARRKPFIHLIRKGEESPFDTKDLRTISVGTEIDEAKQALEEIKKYIPEVEKAGDQILTPISQVIEWELMKASGDVQQKTLAEILPKIDSIERSMNILLSIQNGMFVYMKNIQKAVGYHSFSDYLAAQEAKEPTAGSDIFKTIAESFNANIESIKPQE